MSSQVRLCSYVLLVTFVSSLSAHAEAYKADETAAKSVGIELREAAKANPESATTVSKNLHWILKQVTKTKEELLRNYTWEMKLNTARSGHQELKRLSSKFSSALPTDVMREGVDLRLTQFKNAVNGPQPSIRQAVIVLDQMEKEMSLAIDAYEATSILF